MAFLSGLLGGGPQAQPTMGAQQAQQPGLLGGVGNFFSQQQAQNPAFLNGIAAGLLNGGNVPAAMSAAQAEALKKMEVEQGISLRQQALAQDQNQFAQNFGLQQQEFGLKKNVFESEAQDKRALQNATAQFLESNGADPSLVSMARAGQGAAAFKMYQDLKGSVEYGTTPVYGLDAEGNTVIGQMGKNGTIVQSRRPEGFQPLSPYGVNEQKEAGKAVGKSRGENAASLPNVEVSSAYALQKIDEVLNDPNLGSATGWQGALPSFPGTDKKNLDVKISQLKGQTFLQAFESLKGSGQITEVEGQKAEAAIARLDQAQGDEEFKSALVDLKSVIQTGLQRSRQKAGGLTAQQPAAGNRASTGVQWSIEP